MFASMVEVFWRAADVISRQHFPDKTIGQDIVFLTNPYMGMLTNSEV